MRIVITDFLNDAACEVSRKTGECLKVVLDPNMPAATVSPAEFIKLVRFQSQQEAKRAAQTAVKDRQPQASS